MFCWKKKFKSLGNELHKGFVPEKSALQLCCFSNESSKIRLNLYHCAEAANGKTANPKMTNEEISAQIGHVKSQQGRQQVSISAHRNEVTMYYFHARTGCPWSMES